MAVDWMSVLVAISVQGYKRARRAAEGLGLASRMMRLMSRTPPVTLDFAVQRLVDYVAHIYSSVTDGRSYARQ